MRRLCLLMLMLVVVGCVSAPARPIDSTPTPTAAAVTAAAGPAQDLTPYRAAMKPDFAAEVDRFGTAPRYQIDLKIAPDLKSYAATQKVHYTNTEDVPLHEIYFTLFANLSSYGGKLAVDSVHLNGAPVQPRLNENNTLLKIDLPAPLQPGDSIDVELAYRANVPAEEVEAGYNQFGLHGGILTLPNFYPQIPAYDDEGWNITLGPGYGDAVFSDTALYQVNVTAPADQIIVTSGVCEAPAAPAGQQYQRCVSGPMRDFMIALSPDFEVKTAVVDGVKINAYARGAAVAGNEQALQAATQAVQSYNRRFGAYPFNELDVVGTSTTAGGIEYPGLIVIADKLYQNANPRLDLVVAHEAAHQWWYSLVGNDQVDEPWLDESLTQFSMALYARDWYGPREMSDLIVGKWRDIYQRITGTPIDKRADLPVADYDEQQYGAVVYEKAPLFFNAIYEAIGDEKFDQLLQEYYATYRYGVAYPKDFLAIAAKYVGQEKLDALLQKWIMGP